MRQPVAPCGGGRVIAARWASPAVAGPLVIETFIGRACALDVPGRDGVVVAFDRRSGRCAGGVASARPSRPRWSCTGSSTSPSSVGTCVGTGRPHRQDALDHSRVGGPVKSSPTLARRPRRRRRVRRPRVCARRANGTQRVACLGAAAARIARTLLLGPPAAAYDRAYVGGAPTARCTRCRPRKRAASAGTRSTGWLCVRRTGDLRVCFVLVGSYDHVFYAFDAAIRQLSRWPVRAAEPGAPPSSTASSTSRRSRTGPMRSPRPRDAVLWTWPDGEYSPVVTDGRRIYLTGRGRIYGLAR